MRGSQEHPSYPEIEDTLGYNPARFLNHAIESTSCTTDLTVTSLIRGIQNIDTIRAWIAVEVDLGRADGGPRREIIKQLNRRQVQLEDEAAPVDGAAAADEPAEATESEPASQTADPATIDKRDEPDEIGKPSESSKLSKPSQLSQPDAAPTDEKPIADPTCPVCGEDLIPEEIAGQRGHWCHECRDFREPASDPLSPSADDDRDDASDITPGESSTTATAVTDGGAPDPDTPPQCPDCHGELPTETVGDEDDAHWCDYCGTVVRVGVAV